MNQKSKYIIIPELSVSLLRETAWIKPIISNNPDYKKKDGSFEFSFSFGDANDSWAFHADTKKEIKTQWLMIANAINGEEQNGEEKSLLTEQLQRQENLDESFSRCGSEFLRKFLGEE